VPDVARKAALFALGLWIMGTVCVSVVAAQNFYTIDRLIAAQTPPAFAQAVATLGATQSSVFSVLELRSTTTRNNRPLAGHPTPRQPA
jgi:hypothetical protein